MPYTLLFGNNFIYESPQSVRIYDKILFYLSEDDYGPYLTTEIFDSAGESVIVKAEKNTCTYLNGKELIQNYIINYLRFLGAGRDLSELHKKRIN